MRVHVPMNGPVWEWIAMAGVEKNIPADERVLMSGKEYELKDGGYWYVDLTDGQRCLFT